MSRAKMYKIDPDKLQTYLEVAGGAREVAKKMGWDEWTFHRAYRKGLLSRQAVEDLEKTTKIKLKYYRASERKPFTEDEERQIELMTEALRRYHEEEEQ